MPGLVEDIARSVGKEPPSSRKMGLVESVSQDVGVSLNERANQAGEFAKNSTVSAGANLVGFAGDLFRGGESLGLTGLNTPLLRTASGKTPGQFLQEIGDRAIEASTTGTASDTVGAAIGGVAPSVLLAATPVGIPGMIATFATSNLGEALDEAEKNGIEGAKKWAFALAHTPLAVAEAAPVAPVLNILDKGTGGLIRKTISKVGTTSIKKIIERVAQTPNGRMLLAMLESSPEEAFQESVLNQIPKNVLAKAFDVDPDRGVFDNVGEAAVAGAIGGPIGTAGASAIRRSTGPTGQTPTPEAVPGLPDIPTRPQSTPDLPAAPQPENATLPGGREAGATFLPNVVAEELLATSHRIARSAKSAASSIPAEIRFVASKSTDVMRSQGETGKELAEQVRRVDLRSARNAKRAELDLSKVYKGLSKRQRELVSRVVNSRPGTESAPEWAVSRANAVRSILDSALLNQAQSLGFTREGMPLLGSGKAFPQALSDEGVRAFERFENRGASDPDMYRIAQRMVEEGRAEAIEGALVQLKHFWDGRKRGLVPYIERTRVELPDSWVEWDPNRVLSGVIEKTSRVIEAAREWGGPDTPLLDANLAKMHLEGEPAVVDKIEAFIKSELGAANNVRESSRKLAGAISNYETVIRLGGSVLSAARNSGQRVVNTIDYPLPVILRSLADFPPFINPWLKSATAVKEQVESSGSVRSVTDLGNIETGVPGEKLSKALLKMFTSVETGNQVTASIIAKHGVLRDLDRMARIQGMDSPIGRLLDFISTPFGESSAAIKRRLGRRGVNLSNQDLANKLASGERLTIDQMDEIMNRFVEDTQFTLTMATKPLWWNNNPWLRLAFKFKTFGVRQTGLLYNTVLKEAFKGNVAPLARFALYTMFAGELYNILRDILVGDEESLTFTMINNPDQRNEKDIALRAFADMADGGFLGIMQDITYGIGDFLGGPAVSTAQNFGEAAMDIIRRPEFPQITTAWRRFFEREASLFKQTNVLSLVDKKIANENNDLIAYRVWRDRARKFQDDIEGEGAVERTLSSAIEGFQDFRRTDRSLTYEYAARQISVGDVDDAADYLEAVLDDADPSERKKIVLAMMASMNRRSPLGAVSQANRAKFLKQFPRSVRREAMNLQNSFIRQYKKAIRMAVNRVKAKRN